MKKKICVLSACLLICIMIIPNGITQEVFSTTQRPVNATLLSRNSITIFVNTSAINDRSDLTEQQKTDLKEHILNHIKENFEGALGTGNVTVTDDSSQQGNADRNVSIEPGFSNPAGSAWGQCQGGNDTVRVFLGEFMNDSAVNASFQNPDGTWNVTKLGNALGHTSGHEVGHTYSVGHNHEERPDDFFFFNPPDGTDNRSKMTAGQNINATERAGIRFDFDNHTKDVIRNNADQPVCVAFPDYDDKVLISHFSGPADLPDRPDEARSLDVLFSYITDVPRWYELGFLGEDTDDGIYDGNSDFDFIYKTSLANDPDLDASILTFIDDMHGYTTWVLRGSELSPYPGEWFIVDPMHVILEDYIENPQGRSVARLVHMSWPTLGVMISFNALSFGPASNPYNGFTYESIPTPPVIEGPSNGEPGEQLDYSLISTDPNGMDLFYKVDWDDGTTSDWVGPVPSGSVIQLSHIWESSDLYNIRARAKNIDEVEGPWSEYYPVDIQGIPVLEFGRIEGGLLGYAIELNNTGTGNATNIVWRTSMDGGLILFGNEANGSIPYVAPGSSDIIEIIPVVGLGSTEILIQVDSAHTPPVSRTVEAFILFILVFI